MNELQTFMDAIKGLIDIDEASLTDEVMKEIFDNLEKQFSPGIISQSVNQIIGNMEDQGLNKTEAKAALDALAETMKEMVYSEAPTTGNKKKLIDSIMDKLFGIFNAVAEKYHSYAIKLPIQLEEGAKVPTYAHDSDAAADMYAMEDTEIPAHTNGVPVKTGVHIQLPEGWVAFILPRSSIGAKTPLRLSNSAGVIDSGYRGEVRALYDNISDEPYQIHKEDRIAQMLVMPSYRFKAVVVDSLEDSDRGSGGFGSTGV